MTDSKPQRHGVIQANHYRESEARLQEDPIIKDLAAELHSAIGAGKLDMGDLLHDDASPTSKFMGMILDEYHRRHGKSTEHIGGPANAVIALLKLAGDV